jgi:phage shock protein A
MFESKQLKLEIAAIKNTVEEMMTEIAELKKDYNDYLEWKKQRDANEKAAATQGHWYISSKDAALIEKCIQEINKNEDLCALLTSAEGTTLSLRVHPQPKFNGSVARFNGLGEED